jgi:hypothetical protein
MLAARGSEYPPLARGGANKYCRLLTWLAQADDGYIYPLERAFFYVQKPPLLLVFDDIDSLEFMRQAQGEAADHVFVGVDIFELRWQPGEKVTTGQK